MVRRVKIGEDDLIISRAGFDAFSPSLTDAQKIFDVHWAFANQILYRGRALDGTGNPIGEAAGSANFTITTPNFGYQPAAIILRVGSILPGDGTGSIVGNGNVMRKYGPIRGVPGNYPRWNGNTQLIIPRPVYDGEYQTLGEIIYLLMAV